MSYKGEKLGALIIPTGIGASIGGFAGDAGAYAKKIASKTKLIVNPNVVNAGVFSAITDNMLYVEGYTLNEFFKGRINLVLSEGNNIGIIYDKAIPQDVLNIHINTQNAIKTVYGIKINNYIVTEEPVGVKFYFNENSVSIGEVENIGTVEKAALKLINSGCNAIGIVCMFDDPEGYNTSYSDGVGVDPVGGVEAIISHSVSKKFKIPCAHSPAFSDYTITTEIVNPKSSAEYITPTFLPCILLGLNCAPQITQNTDLGININNLDYLVMPHNCLGSIPVIESLKRGIKIFAVKENSTILNVTKQNLYRNSNIIEVETYEDVLNEI